MLERRSAVKANWTKDLPGHDWSWRGDGGWWCKNCKWISDANLAPQSPCVGPGKARR
jgi:hypothetical protein